MSRDTKTGYPSIDKPWLKYYTAEAINTELPEMTLYEYAYNNNEEHIENIAFKYYGTKITYGEFFEKVKQTAASFNSIGVKKKDIVTIMSMNTPETIIAIYALNYIGAVANLVYMTLSENEIIDTLENTQSKALLILDKALEKIADIGDRVYVPIIVLGVTDSMPRYMKIIMGHKQKGTAINKKYRKYKEFLKDGIGTSAIKSDNHNDVAVIVYTSGTTGAPKGVCLSSDNINSVVQQYFLSGMHFGRGEKYLHMMPVFFAFGICTLHLSLCAGIEANLILELETQKVIAAFKKYKPNHFLVGPVYIDSVIEGMTDDTSYLIDISGGGGTVDILKEKTLNECLKKHGSPAVFTQGYGMTETSGTVCTNQHNIHKLGSMGIPLPKVNVKIIDVDTKKELRYDEIGEIYVNSPSIFQKYFNNIEDTETPIEVNGGKKWLRTGDLGYMDIDGFLFSKGRIKRIFITKNNKGVAYKLFPVRIEELFESNQNVNKCGVVVIEDIKNMNIAIAFVSLINSEETARTLAELKKLSKEELPEHNRPREIFIINDMPITSNGKINYSELEKILELYNE